MLTHIYIRDFAIIETLDLELQTGMTALTGETGAGKSILVDAIGLVLGDRADSGVVRYGADTAEITLSVDVSSAPTAKAWLEEQALDTDDVCILRRVISAAGKSRAWINGSPSNLTMLRQLGEQLVEIHGQHEHQSLMKKDKQRHLLDDFADTESLLTQVEKAYQSWKQVNNKLEALSSQSSDYQAKLDLLRFQTQELNDLQLVEGEVQSLDKEYARLSNAGQLIETSSRSILQLYDDDEQSVYSQLSHILVDIEQQKALDDAFNEPYELLLSAQIQVQEATELLRQYQDSIELDPERLDWVEKRVSLIHHLARKHHSSSEELYDKWNALSAELAALEGDDYDLDALEAKCQQMREAYLKKAKILSNKRQKMAKKLSQGVSEAMQALGMQGGVFRVNVEFLEDAQMTMHGMDHIEFEVSANPGQPLKPLVKVASGGELSRISLAIQMIAAQQVTLPALIFDEVDSGIGGGTAEVVGQQLRSIGNNLQVLCVTHLPQVASQAHHHYKVTKVKGKSSTSTGMIKLEFDDRVEEIARMMGGVEITQSTLTLATEMLASS